MPQPRMSPSPLPALLGKVSTALAHRHWASVLFLARPSPGAQALRTHPRRPGRAPPRPTRTSPKGAPLRPGLPSRGSPALPRSFFGGPSPRGPVLSLVRMGVPLPGSTLTLHSSWGELLWLSGSNREEGGETGAREKFLLSLVLEGEFQESICPVDPFLPVGTVQS